jgi:hypothetical protein
VCAQAAGACGRERLGGLDGCPSRARATPAAAAQQTCRGRKASNQLPIPALRVEGSVEITIACAAAAPSAAAARAPSARGGVALSSLKSSQLK